MNHFPLFVNLKGREVKIFGGGDFALQRINKLLPFEASITVISPSISRQIQSIPQITCLEREYLPGDLDSHPALVVIAEDKETTARIYNQCQNRHILVNSVDMPEYCDVIFPAFFTAGHLCVGVSSGGISPTSAVVFRDRFKELVPPDIDHILEWMPAARDFVKNQFSVKTRNSILRQVFTLAMEKNRPLEEEEICAIAKEYER